MTLYGSVDLHSNNSYVAISDENDRVISHKRIPNTMIEINRFFTPYARELSSIAVESTFNGYWLLDGLKEEGFNVKLIHTPACEPYKGLKYTDDKSDCFWMNRMNRLNILPEGYIYPKEERSIRDLLRKRMYLVNMRTKTISALKQQFLSWKALRISKENILSLTLDELEKLIPDPFLRTQIKSYQEITIFTHQQIKKIECLLKEHLKDDDVTIRLQNLYGIGSILSWVIRYETGDLSRFKNFKKYLSYCGLVESKRMSNKKKKGKGNAKNRNLYLRWAFAELAVFSLKNPLIKQYHTRLLKKKCKPKAIAIISSKLARIVFMTMKDEDFKYEEGRLFGSLGNKGKLELSPV